MPKPIDIEIKIECCRMLNNGSNSRQVYDEYFSKQFENPQTYESFRRSLQRWQRHRNPDQLTLDAGTYDGFVAHGATVQVDAQGNIVQSWIKQHSGDFDETDFINSIKDNVKRIPIVKNNFEDSSDMLEISLFDMHWGIAFMDYYSALLNDILNVITSKHWAKIVIPFGQDFFHNDSIINGETTKGTVIDKVDMVRAVKEGQQFMYSIIDTAIENSDETEVLYSPGNHDKSISWMFVQVLLERYGKEIVDDSIELRKVITYGKNAIMVVHGDSKRANPKNLAHIFPVMFPKEFSNATVREVHAGHLHSESDTDVYGIMVRRLASGNITDTWSDNEDYVGTLKRFMLFVWNTEKLKSIIYE